jgi:23S rRNA U2552 (ribose-2'-O)-methylase RlmE/FtsJ
MVREMIIHQSDGKVDLSFGEFLKELAQDHPIVLLGDTNHTDVKLQHFMRYDKHFFDALKEADIQTMAYEIPKYLLGDTENVLNATPSEDFNNIVNLWKTTHSIAHDPVLLESDKQRNYSAAIAAVALAGCTRANGLNVAFVDTDSRKQAVHALIKQGIDPEIAEHAGTLNSDVNLKNLVKTVKDHPEAYDVLEANREAIYLNRTQDNAEIAANIREIAARDGKVAVMFGAGHMRCPHAINEHGEETLVGLQHLLKEDGAAYVEMFTGKKESWLEDMATRLERGYSQWKDYQPIPFSKESLPEYLVCLKQHGNVEIIHVQTALEAYKSAQRENQDDIPPPPWIERISYDSNRLNIPRNR